MNKRVTAAVLNHRLGRYCGKFRNRGLPYMRNLLRRGTLAGGNSEQLRPPLELSTEPLRYIPAYVAKFLATLFRLFAQFVACVATF